MALNIQTFRTRAITAVVFAAVMLAGLLTNGYVYTILFLVILAGSVVEFIRLYRKVKPSISWLLPAGLIYVILPFLLMIDLGTGWLRTHNVDAYSPALPCTIIFSIWINDTMAYIVGSFIGKTPFSSISPKKTWEGTIGGAILCVLVMAGLSLIIKTDLTTINVIVIASLAAVFGTIGDLLESKIKRMAGVKDSGKIMPGHGGFLDRFDSLMLAAPFVWLYSRFFM
ncbi:MAG: phosphatidate cytidylyltransferase [Chitinophagaceae bacterium]|nr:MAG: phosphatidate cytidylyltransferase [Chitinophagaceae bacterium]